MPTHMGESDGSGWGLKAKCKRAAIDLGFDCDLATGPIVAVTLKANCAGGKRALETLEDGRRIRSADEIEEGRGAGRLTGRGLRVERKARGRCGEGADSCSARPQEGAAIESG